MPGDIIELPRRRHRPGRPVDPDRAAATILGRWAHDSGLTDEEIASRINEAIGVTYVHPRMIAMWRQGISFPAFNVGIALLELAGRAGVAGLAELTLS